MNRTFYICIQGRSMIERPAPIPVHSGDRPDVRSVVLCLLRHPVYSFVRCWNWKAAILSCMLRSPVYVITTFRHGWLATTLATVVEAVFSAAAAGVYAAFTESVRYAEPESEVAVILLIILPLLTLAMDALLHYLTRTPNLGVGVFLSVAVTMVSSAFNWYSMRRGALLVGSGSRSFSSDLRCLPVLIVRFLLEPFTALWKNRRMVGATSAED